MSNIRSITASIAKNPSLKRERIAANTKSALAFVGKAAAYLSKASTYVDRNVADFSKGSNSKMAKNTQAEIKSSMAKIQATSQKIAKNASVIQQAALKAYSKSLLGSDEAVDPLMEVVEDAATVSAKAALLATFASVNASENPEEILEVDEAGYVVEDPTLDTVAEGLVPAPTDEPLEEVLEDSDVTARSAKAKPKAPTALPKNPEPKMSKHPMVKKATDGTVPAELEDGTSGHPSEAADDLIVDELDASEVVATTEELTDEDGEVDLSTLSADDVEESTETNILPSITSKKATASGRGISLNQMVRSQLLGSLS